MFLKKKENAPIIAPIWEQIYPKRENNPEKGDIMSFEMTLPSSVDEVYGGELAKTGVGEIEIVESLVQVNKAQDGQVWKLVYKRCDHPDSYPIQDFISFPKDADIQGAEKGGYVDIGGNQVTQEQCQKRIAAGMAGIARAVKAFKIPYRVDKKSGKTVLDIEKAVGKRCEAEVVIRPMAYQDGQPEIPVHDPTIKGTADDPNFGRATWPEGRAVRLPALPTKAQAEGKSK